MSAAAKAASKPNPKRAILFLAGRYHESHLSYYKSLCRGRLTVAVDGGYRFFERAGVTPDVLLGDFDSLKGLPKSLPRRTRVVPFPSNKDKTDTHLALDYVFDQGVHWIDIVQPNVGEPDHFMANLFLLSDIVAEGRQRRPEMRLLNTRSEVVYLEDTTLRLDNALGDRVSVIPLSQRLELTCRGTAYDVGRLKVRRGQTVTARNLVIEDRPVFQVTGKSLALSPVPQTPQVVTQRFIRFRWCRPTPGDTSQDAADAGR